MVEVRGGMTFETCRYCPKRRVYPTPQYRGGGFTREETTYAGLPRGFHIEESPDAADD